jgi:hypothetical protein
MHFLMENIQRRLHSSTNKNTSKSKDNSKNKEKYVSDFLQNQYSNTRNFYSGKTLRKGSCFKPSSNYSKNYISNLFEFKKYTQLV